MVSNAVKNTHLYLNKLYLQCPRREADKAELQKLAMQER